MKTIVVNQGNRPSINQSTAETVRVRSPGRPSCWAQDDRGRPLGLFQPGAGARPPLELMAILRAFLASNAKNNVPVRVIPKVILEHQSFLFCFLLKANLTIQEARLNKANASLTEAQDQLDEKQKELDVVQAMYDAAISEKQTLLDDAESCRRKMTNATTLIEGLGGEKVRWTEASKRFQDQINRWVENGRCC